VDLEDDLLGVNLAPAPAAAASGISSGNLPMSADVRVGLQAGAPVREWLAAFASTLRGKLYEDEYVQIGAQVDIQGERGTVTLFIGNRTQGPLNLLKVRVPDVPHLRVAVADVEPVLGKGQQAKVAITVECLKPFVTTAQLQVSFLSAPSNGHALPLRLPVFASHFVAPVTVTKDTFGARWKALAPETGQAQHSAPSVSHATQVLKGLHFAETLTDASAAYCAGSYKTATVANGANVVVGCLVKVAVLPAGYGVEMRTQHPEVSRALLSIVKAELSQK
jgi:AP-2 complex subunit alpha